MPCVTARYQTKKPKNNFFKNNYQLHLRIRVKELIREISWMPQKKREKLVIIVMSKP